MKICCNCVGEKCFHDMSLKFKIRRESSEIGTNNMIKTVRMPCVEFLLIGRFKSLQGGIQFCDIFATANRLPTCAGTNRLIPQMLRL